MSAEEQVHYQPGQIANGHMLGADNVWRPVPHFHEVHPVRRSYWALWQASWGVSVKWTTIVSAVVGVIAMIDYTANPAPGKLPVGVLDVVLGAALAGFFYGSFIALIVAAVRYFRAKP